MDFEKRTWTVGDEPSAEDFQRYEDALFAMIVVARLNAYRMIGGTL